ncbi:MAG: 50S ribosomal protein L18e [Candidatus Bathyarchaeota archaeon]|nr:50S ribosomal protein L18e [Candidatus Bathyarchaeum tardum]WGM89590.1 MAG: 50S ribosomal protein L18e [Candidatus Bathyarchaeum tardum]WNZ30307.1 MAG: 50S ribosomal protein L18e [Candidatus Bathyarchaeota archaeon]
MKKLKSTNPELVTLIRDLKKQSQESQTELWLSLAERLNSSNRSRVAVNLSRLNRYTKEGETVVVPGKVLGAGQADHPLNIAAFSFSDVAKTKIANSKGQCLSIRDLMKKNPTGKNVKIME